MAALCAIRRPLTDDEIRETLRLRKLIRDSRVDRREYDRDYKRQRYASDPDFRAAVRARTAAYKARRHSGDEAA